MKKVIGTGLVGATIAVVGLVGATSAAGGVQGPPGEPNMYFLKSSGASSFCCIGATIKPGKTKTFTAVATNSGSNGDTFGLEGFGTSATDYKVDWYQGLKAKSSKKITSAVLGSGYEFFADANTATPFTVTVKRKQGDEACLASSLSADGGNFSYGTVQINGGVCIF